MEKRKELLLKKVQVCDFILFETSLFLDTHPDHQEALIYFNKHVKERAEAVREYTEQFGPITHADNTSTTSWEYARKPFPWDNEEA